MISRDAHLAVEDLSVFLKADTRVLARAQYATLLEALDRRLELAGREPMRANGQRYWKVHPAFTSTTCPECGVMDRASRLERDIFKCVRCGHEAHADMNAARNIARLGRENKEKCDIARHREVPGKGGGGPASNQDAGVVSAPVSAAAALSGDGGAHSPLDGSNAGETLLAACAERSAIRVRHAVLRYGIWRARSDRNRVQNVETSNTRLWEVAASSSIRLNAAQGQPERRVSHSTCSLPLNACTIGA